MMNKNVAGLLMIGVLSASVFGKTVNLRIDYSDGRHCIYAIEYTSQGNFKQKGSVTKKTTGVNCILSAHAVNPDKVGFKVDSVTITSNLYDASKVSKLRDDLLASSYDLSLIDGSPVLDTSQQVPAAKHLEWDLYRQLIKLLPALPGKNVKPGFKWENTATVTMQTARGVIPCELYRFYTFKKLQGDTATISWNFRYAPAENAKDGVNALEEIPIGGNGSGMALIDVGSGSIISADMSFSTPVAVIDAISVTWKERAVFTLKQCK